MILCIVVGSFAKAKNIWESQEKKLDSSSYTHIYLFYPGANPNDKFRLFDERLFSRFYVGTYSMTNLDHLLQWAEYDKIQLYIDDSVEDSLKPVIVDRYTYKRNNIEKILNLDNYSTVLNIYN